MSLEEKDVAKAFADNKGLPKTEEPLKQLPYARHSTIPGVWVAWCPCGKDNLSETVNTEWFHLRWCQSCGQRYYLKKARSSTQEREEPGFV